MPRAYYNEIDPYAADWLENLISAGHIAPGDVDRRSIVDVRPDDVKGYRQCHWFAGIAGWSYALRLAGWPDDREVWTGSCPCPPFSSAGKKFACPECDARSPVPCPRRTGYFICWNCSHAWLADARHLWPELWRLVAECRPEHVFGEQVASTDGLVWLAGVRASLEILGYSVGAEDRPAASVDAPHIRQRLWWVANADGGNASTEGIQRSRQHGQFSQDDGAALRMANAECERREMALQQSAGGGTADELRQANGSGSGGTISGLGQAENEPGHIIVDHEDAAIGNAEPDRIGSAYGPWSDAEWIACSDGKSRRVKSGTFPLVDGSAFKLGSGSALEGKSRAGMLRAYGNAITPPVAAEFIAAYLECRP